MDPKGTVVIPASSSRKIDCAKAGIRELLSGLLPCNPNLQTCGTAPPLDQVGLMVYPPLKAQDATTHDNTGNSAHSNINLETSSSCSGELNNESPTGLVHPQPIVPQLVPAMAERHRATGHRAAAAVAAVDEVDP